MLRGVIGRISFALAFALAVGTAVAQESGDDFFEANVRPIFVKRCYQCHAVAKPKGELHIDSRAGLLHGGASGPAIVPGDPEKSLLVQAIRWTDEELKMPPKGGQLEKAEIAAIEEWIRRGAPVPDAAVAPVTSRHWAFEPVQDPEVPRVAHKNWVRDTLDAFVLARLEAKGLEGSSEADPRTLLRRLTLDLTGLPATKEEVDAFARSPGDYEKAVDRLLASPAFGERWGRHWLDVARYADTRGVFGTITRAARRYPYAYTYRDWVVRAFNEDLPYDRFLVEQIAADLIPGADRRSLAALGFLTVGRRYFEDTPDVYDDRIDVVTRGLLGLTVSCARCHDHKYDPIPTEDYYSLYGVFASSRVPLRLPTVEEKPAETSAYAQFHRALAENEEAVTALRKKYYEQVRADLGTEKKVAEYVEAARDPQDADMAARARGLSAYLVGRWRAFVAARPEIAALGSSAAAARLAGTRLEPLDFPLSELEVVLGASERDLIAEARNRTTVLEATHPGAPPCAMTLEDVAAPVEPRVFVRGDPANPGRAVPRRFLACLSRERPAWTGSGRLELASAIASKENPLTARVFVNRVWQHLLGAPLVRTPSDFGLRSEPPTNPALLDHLARRFMDGGWSTKKLIRSIVLSATYRQSSAGSSQKDPENELLSRANRKRLDLEATRDSILTASGQLDRTIGGRPVDGQEPRRTLYLFVDRTNLDPTFRTFDFPSPEAHAPERHVTTVPQQALFFMNSRLVLEAAQGVAARLPAPPTGDPSAWIDALYARVLARAPTGEERALGKEFLAAATNAPTTAWSYGYGRLEEGRVARFAPLPYWTGELYQGSLRLPDPALGWCLLSATGGRPGDDKDHAIVRRWVAPEDGTVVVSGKIARLMAQGDGVRAHVVSSAAGELAAWTVKDAPVEAAVPAVTVRRGDRIDFVVELLPGTENGVFTWAPRLASTSGGQTATDWNAQRDFGGPLAGLSSWERYAQVLLESDEFVFED
jgi:mono/diheme cytochrome c family protein